MDPTTTEAIQTTAKILVAAPVIQLARRFLENIGDPTTKKVGEDLLEQYKSWRASNVQATAQNAVAKLKARGVEGDVPKAFLFPLLNAAGDVDAPELQELWAELIANGVENDANCHPAFIQTLASLNARDAETFAGMVRASRDHPSHRFDVTADECDVRDRLMTLGLVVWDPEQIELSRWHRYDTDSTELIEQVVAELKSQRESPLLSLSGYGESFARAVGLLPEE